MLICRGISKRFGGVVAVDAISLDLRPGEITAVVGANGAGKTTLLDCLSGHLSLDDGSVEMSGRAIGQLQPWERARLGLLRGFQDNRLFPSFTVAETLRIARYRVAGYGFVGALLRTPKVRRLEADTSAFVDRVLAAYHLTEYANRPVSELSMGMSKVLMLACLAASNPQWVLLDEPSAGLARKEIERLAPMLKEAVTASSSLGILLVEHDAALVAEAADRVVVMERGRVIHDLHAAEAGWDKLLGRATGRRSFGELTPAPIGAAVLSEPPTGAPEVSARLAGIGLTIRYGRFEAVSDANLDVRPGRIACLVGTNGAGKSSVMKALAGLLQPASGVVQLDGVSIRNLSSHSRVGRGVVLVPSGRGVLPSLTVDENFSLARDRASAYRLDRADVLVDPLDLFPTLAAHRSQVAGTLSGGEQQMLALGRVLYLRPRFLLIDELSLGLKSEVVERLVEVLRRLRDAGLGILVVEQDAPFALTWASHAFVMNRGRIVFDGPAADAARRTDLFRPVFLGDRVVVD
jgi:ABC-type branched-subunit amino acid transport system ATPase component